MLDDIFPRLSCPPVSLEFVPQLDILNVAVDNKGVDCGAGLLEGHKGLEVEVEKDALRDVTDTMTIVVEQIQQISAVELTHVA